MRKFTVNSQKKSTGGKAPCTSRPYPDDDLHAFNEVDGALIEAARGGSVNGITEALLAGASLEARTRNPSDHPEEPSQTEGSYGVYLQAGRTALMEAVRQGQVKAVEILLRSGADVNAVSGYSSLRSFGDTALHFAVSYPSEKTVAPGTVLIRTLRETSHDIKTAISLVRLMLRHRAKPGIRSAEGNHTAHSLASNFGPIDVLDFLTTGFQTELMDEISQLKEISEDDYAWDELEAKNSRLMDEIDELNKNIDDSVSSNGQTQFTGLKLWSEVKIDRLEAENARLREALREATLQDIFNVDTQEAEQHELRPVEKKQRLDISKPSSSSSSSSSASSSSSSSSSSSGMQELVAVKKEASDKLGKVRLEAENFENRSLCVMCLEADRSCLYLPCKHLLTCRACDEDLEAVSAPCPFCNEAIEARLADIFVP